MAKRQYQDAAGKWIEIDDEVSLLGPPPKEQPKESTRDTRYQPIHYDYTGRAKQPPKPHDPRTLGPQGGKVADECKDAGNSGLNDPEYLKRMGLDNPAANNPGYTGKKDKP